MSTQRFRIGGFATDTVTDIICIQGKVATSGQVCTLRKTGQTAGYQVTAGKTLYCAKLVVFNADTAAVNNAVGLGYADNDVGRDTATARTNPVAVIGDPEQTTVAAMAGITFVPSASGGMAAAVASQPLDSMVFAWAPSQKYPYFKAIVGTTGLTVIAWCFEA